ncbi:MAG: hypothetical protein M1825_006469 [Sarcosagium campestre]|nr:MAG: hypothetical protein M1825_006469 [Sarcosagium campestre]
MVSIKTSNDAKRSGHETPRFRDSHRSRAQSILALIPIALSTEDPLQGTRHRHFSSSRLEKAKNANSWDTAYEVELSNHRSNPSDEGTVWFSDACAAESILDYLSGSAPSAADISSPPCSPSASVLDLGTGNGHLLFLLRDEAGFTGPMVGVDYSPQSIQLARQIAAERQKTKKKQQGEQGEDVEVEVEVEGSQDAHNGDSSSTPTMISTRDVVRLEQWDIMSDEQPGDWFADATAGHGFDVILDKGTFDAISLSADVDATSGRRIYESYPARVSRLLKPSDGLLLVTSCNWTEDELRSSFEVDENGSTGLEACDRIAYPTFEFGGKKGQSVCSVIFRRTR